MIRTVGPSVLRVDAENNMPPSAFTLNDRNGVEDIQFEVVAGPKAIPHTGLQEVAVPEEW